MAVELSVADVRAALTRAAGSEAAGDGEPATLLLGRIFHEVFGELSGVDPERSGLRVIAEAGDGRAATDAGADREVRITHLREHAWTRLIAPRLLRHAASLQSSSDRVLTFWRATKQLTAWLTDVVVELLKSHRDWQAVGESLRADVSLECELQEPGWSEPVRLVGVADAVLFVPTRARYCAIELKLGRAAPVVDLGQVVLYHLMLSRTKASLASALALLRFSPELEEHVVEASALAEAERRLIALIGQIAKVAPAESVPVVEPAAAAPVQSKTIQSKTVVEPPRMVSEPPPPLASAAPTAEHHELGKRLVRAYRDQGVTIELRGAPLVGPRFVRFGVRLAPGARIDALRRRTAEVQLRLNVRTEPLVVVEAGQLFVDLARPDPALVRLHDVVEALPSIDPLRGSAKVLIGVDPAGHVRFADLASAGRSHVLVAGTSGSGKSEWLRTALAALIMTNTPETLRLVTIDPKLAAFNDLEKSRFLWRKDAWWIPGSGRQASELFHDLIEEMEERYQMTRKTGSDNLADHVAKTKKPLPRIVCICDEYSALVSQSREEKQQIEHAVSLLGAKARAAGIHLVLATQQPSRATISGAIQTNLPCRVALYLASGIESNMILGASGAERLTGSGDLLYRDFGDPVRLQAPYLPPEERAAILSS